MKTPCISKTTRDQAVAKLATWVLTKSQHELPKYHCIDVYCVGGPANGDVMCMGSHEFPEDWMPRVRKLPIVFWSDDWNDYYHLMELQQHAKQQ